MSHTTPAPPDAPEVERSPAQSALIIITLCLSVVVIIAGVASLNVAIPTIGRELQATQSQLQWIIDAYAIALAALLLPAGALGDRFGRKKLMVIGYVGLVASAIWAASTNDINSLIVARAMGGAFSALIFPGTLSTITNVIPPARRGFAVAMWTASASLGGTLGSLGAGALIESFWFGSIFAALAVIGVLIGMMTAFFVPETSDPTHANLDPIGSVSSIVGLGALTLGIIEGPVKGWSSTLVITSFIVAVIGLTVFITWELRTSRPLLDVRLFKLRGFSTGSVSIFLQFFAAFGFFFIAAQYLAFVFGYSPFVIGAAFLPLGLSIPLASGMAPKLAERFGRGPIGGIGLGVLATGSALFTLLGTGSEYWAFAVAVLVFGVGMGLAAPPATEAIVEALPARKQGVASAINDVSRELGGALGIALIGSMFTSGYQRGIDDADLPPELTDVVREAPAIGLGVAAEAGEAAPTIVGSVEQAVTDGFSLGMWFAAASCVVGAIFVVARSPKPGTEAS
ncbi:MAG: DHA2 family efflux MFS transporter permease subunit, partial [Actinomycetota bacterium]